MRVNSPVDTGETVPTEPHKQRKRSSRSSTGASQQRRPEGGTDGARLVDWLVEQIRARIASGEYPVGYKLRQETLGREFRVSRTPIREALQQLHANGLVALDHNRGAQVRGVTAREVREAYLVRAELEGMAAELSAQLITEGQMQRLTEAETGFRDTVTQLVERRRNGNIRRNAGAGEFDDSWIVANDAFHDVILEASCNETIRRMIEFLHRSFPRTRIWQALHDDLRLMEENVKEHRLICDAIKNGDADEARRLMIAHIRHTGELIAMRL